MSGQNDLTQGNITSMLLRYAGPLSSPMYCKRPITLLI